MPKKKTPLDILFSEHDPKDYKQTLESITCTLYAQSQSNKHKINQDAKFAEMSRLLALIECFRQLSSEK